MSLDIMFKNNNKNIEFDHNKLYYLDLKNPEISKALNKFIGTLDCEEFPEGFVDIAADDLFDNYGNIALSIKSGLYVYTHLHRHKKGWPLSLKEFIQLIHYIQTNPDLSNRK